MNSQSRAAQAAAAATALGVNPSALAATCMMENQCQNDGVTTGASDAAGAFQMISSTCTSDINGAIAEDPSIAGSIAQGLAGRMDSGTEAYAAAYELQRDAIQLQAAGISTPTVVDARAVHQFEAGVGASVAKADDPANIESIVGLSSSALASNGLTASSTVGDRRSMQATTLSASAAQVELASR